MTRAETDFRIQGRGQFDVMASLPAEGIDERTVRVIRETVGPGYERIELRGPSRRRHIRGIASTARVCDDKDSLGSSGCLLSLPLPLLFDHGFVGKKAASTDIHRMRIGELVLLQKSAQMVLIEAVMDDSRAADHAWSLIESGECRCLSILSEDRDLSGVVDGIRFYDRWTLKEVSVCRSGKNPDAMFWIVGNYDVDFV